MDFEFFTLSFLLILCTYIRILYGVYFLAFLIFVSSFGFFFSCNGIYITTSDFPNCDIFYETFIGDNGYSVLYAKLSLFHSIRRMFSLPSCYKPFGIFYYNPKSIQKKKTVRAIIGILCDKEERCKSFKDYNDFDYATKMKNNNYTKSSIGQIKCRYGDYETYLSIKNSFVFIARLFIHFANQKFFVRLHNPKWKKSTIKKARVNYRKHFGVLEIFDEKVIKFYIPIEDASNFSFKCD